MADEIVAVYRAEVEQYKKAVDELVGRVNALDKEQKKAGDTATKMGERFKGLGREIITAFGVTAGIAGFVSVMRGAFNAAKDFEAQMSKVRAVSGATATEMDKLEASAKALGASTMFTATQVGQLQEEYAKLGFTTKEILAATAATLDLAAATGSTLAQAAEVAGATVQGFGMDASETVRVTDVMAQSFNRSALDIERFRESIKLVAPIARAANIDLETTTALLGELANAGLSGSIAGTALKNLLSKLSDENSDLSKQLGFAVKNSGDLFLAFEKLAEMNIDLTEATELTDERSKAAFITLFNGIDTVKDLDAALRDASGTTREMAEIMQDNLAGSITKMTSAWEGFTNELLGSQGAIKATVDLLTESITGLTLLIGSDTIKQFQALKDRATILDAALIGARKSVDDLIKPLAESGDTAAANAKAMELVAAASTKLATKQKQQTEATDALNKKEEEHKALFMSLNPLNNARAIALEDELEQLKLRKIAADTEVESIEAVIGIYERYVEQLKEAGGAGGAIESNVRSIDLLNAQLKTLKDQLTSAEIGSDGFWNVLFKIEKKIKELKDAEAMTKLIDDLNPDADDNTAQDERIFSQTQAEIDKYNKLKKEREDYLKFLSEQNSKEIQAELEKINEIEAAEKAARERKKQEEQLAQEQAYEVAMAAMNATIQIIGIVSQAQQQATQYELEQLQNALDAGQITREEYDTKRKQLLREQAKQDKELALIQAIIATAAAVAEALPNVPLSIIAGVLGAAQVAAIAAQPLPQFAKGVIDLQGKGTGTSDSILARLSKGESVMTNEETKQHKPLFTAIRKGMLDEYINKNYVRPAIDSAMLAGLNDIGRSADLNGLTAKLSDHNIIAAMDRNRSATVYGLKMLADKLDKRTQKRGGYA
jgi:TP901 family phage tail tape measure protein